MTKDELAEEIKKLNRYELITALNFLIGNDARAAEDAIRYTRMISSRLKIGNSTPISAEESLELYGQYPPPEPLDELDTSGVPEQYQNEPGD